MLKRLYYDVNSPACFSSANTLYLHAKREDPGIKYKDVTKFLEAQYPYSLHKQTHINFPRNQVVAVGKDSHWQADLCDMKYLKNNNKGYTFILTVVDVLSKFGFAEPVKHKTSTEVTAAFQKIIERSGRKPWFLMVDKGTEFRGSFRTFMDENDIELHVTASPVIKAPNVERFNRTLKTRLWKYFTHKKTKKYVDVLQNIIHAINNRYSRPIKMRPSEVTFENDKEVWQRLYGTKATPAKFKYTVGDRVRIAATRGTFHKGYLPRFTKSVFVVTHRLARDPPVYRVKQEDTDEAIEGIFYSQELVIAA